MLQTAHGSVEVERSQDGVVVADGIWGGGQNRRIQRNRWGSMELSDVAGSGDLGAAGATSVGSGARVSED